MAKVKTQEKTQVKKVTETGLARKINKLGKLKLQINELQKKYKELETELKEILPEGEKLETDLFETVKRKEVRTSLNPEKVYKKLKSVKKLIEIVAVTKSKAKKYLSEKDMSECEGDATIVVKLDIKPKKK